MLLRIIYPDGSKTIEYDCDSVHFMTADKTTGGEVKTGQIGIRKGHIPALISIMPGKLTAYLNGDIVFETQLGEGLASVQHDILTVILK